MNVTNIFILYITDGEMGQKCRMKEQRERENAMRHTKCAPLTPMATTHAAIHFILSRMRASNASIMTISSTSL